MASSGGQAFQIASSGTPHPRAWRRATASIIAGSNAGLFKARAPIRRRNGSGWVSTVSTRRPDRAFHRIDLPFSGDQRLGEITGKRGDKDRFRTPVCATSRSARPICTTVRPGP